MFLVGFVMFQVSSDEAIEMAKLLALKEGLLVSRKSQLVNTVKVLHQIQFFGKLSCLLAAVIIVLDLEILLRLGFHLVLLLLLLSEWQRGLKMLENSLL